MENTSDSQLQYDQDVKKECQSKLIEHAVRCLTTERDTSACVQRDHVRRVWQQFQESKVCIRAKWPIRPELIPVSVA